MQISTPAREKPAHLIVFKVEIIALPTLSKEEIVTNPLSHGMAVNTTLQMLHKYVKLRNKEADFLLDKRSR